MRLKALMLVMSVLEILNCNLHANYNLRFMFTLFFSNLISIHKLIFDQNYIITFLLLIFSFLESYHRRGDGIKITKENDELYYFFEESNGRKMLSMCLQS